MPYKSVSYFVPQAYEHVTASIKKNEDWWERSQREIAEKKQAAQQMERNAAAWDAYLREQFHQPTALERALSGLIDQSRMEDQQLTLERSLYGAMHQVHAPRKQPEQQQGYPVTLERRAPIKRNARGLMNPCKCGRAEGDYTYHGVRYCKDCAPWKRR